MKMTPQLQSYYPMNFQHKIIGNQIEIDLCHCEDVTPGLIFNITCVPKFCVTEVVLKREPGIKSDKNPNNKNNHPDGVMFYTLKGNIMH